MFFQRPSWLLITLISLLFRCASSHVALAAGGTLALDEALAQALEKNPRILQAREEIRRTRGYMIEVRAGRYPTIGTTASAANEDDGRFEGFGGFARDKNSVADFGFRVTQSVYSGGKLAGNYKIGQLAEEEAAAAFETTVQDVVLAVRKTYYEAQRSRSLIDVSTQQIKLLEEELESQRVKVKAGTAPQFNALRAEVELANVKPQLIRARNNHRIALAELAKLIAADFPNGKAAPWDVTAALVVKQTKFDLASSIGTALASRTELAALERRVDAAKVQVKLDGADLKPSVSVFGGYDFIAPRFSGGEDVYHGYIVGLQAEWKIWDFGRTKGQREQSLAKQRQAELSVEDARRQIELEVRKAWSKHTEAVELLESQQKSVSLAEEALRLARSRFDAGAATQLDVLSTQTALTLARTNELQARADYNTAVAEMQRAMGSRRFGMTNDK